MPAELLEKPTIGGGPVPPRDADERPGDGSGGNGGGLLGDPARFGLWAFMATASMLFIGFTSAYILRRASSDWQPFSPPALLFVNTALLLASSATLEAARRRLRAWNPAAAVGWVGVTGALGVAFVVGQVMAWRTLSEAGIFLASNPHSSFFYVLTGAHGVHLLGGLAWFGVAFARARRLAYPPGEDGLRLFATYWHFLAVLWLYLLFLLFVL